MCDYTRLCHDCDAYCDYSDYCIILTIMEGWCELFLSKTNIRDGQHTEGIMLAKNPSGLITSAGHWHGLVVPGICTWSSVCWAVSAMNVDGMPWIELVPTVDALKAQCYWQPFRAVRFASSRISTHAVNRFSLAAMFRQWPNRCQLQRNWN